MPSNNYYYYRTYVGVKVHTKMDSIDKERSVYSAGENVKDLAALLKQLKNGRKGLENEEWARCATQHEKQIYKREGNG